MTLLLTGAGPAVAVPFSPDSISGLIGWWKADSLALSDGAAVSSWGDSSSGGHALAQATGANQPIYKTNVTNGKPGVLFDGVNDYLDAAVSVSGKPLSWIIVARPHAATTQVLMQGQAGGAFQTLMFGTPPVFQFAHDSVGNILTESGNFTVDQARVVTVTYDTSGNAAIYANGTAVGTATNNQTVTASNLRVGATSGGGAPLNGHVFEILMFNTVLSTTDRQNTESYLKTKYGL